MTKQWLWGKSGDPPPLTVVVWGAIAAPAQLLMGVLRLGDDGWDLWFGWACIALGLVFAFLAVDGFRERRRITRQEPPAEPRPSDSR